MNNGVAERYNEGKRKSAKLETLNGERVCLRKKIKKKKRKKENVLSPEATRRSPTHGNTRRSIAEGHEAACESLTSRKPSGCAETSAVYLFVRRSKSVWSADLTS